MKDTEDVEIILKVPGGKYCWGENHSCRFVVEEGNHPGWYCFLFPASHWDNSKSPLKHKDCPSLSILPKRMKGETQEVIERLNKFRLLHKEKGMRL